MVSAPSVSDGDRLVVGRLGGEEEGLDLARLVAPCGEGSEDAGIPTARVAPRVLAGAGLPSGHHRRRVWSSWRPSALSGARPGARLSDGLRRTRWRCRVRAVRAASGGPRPSPW